MTIISGAGIVIYSPDRTHILLIKDSRSHKWSIPKGSVESYDDALIATAIREVQEESGYTWGIDYMIDQIDGQFTQYLIFSGIAISDNLRFTSCLKEFVEEVKWIPVMNMHKLRLNFVSILWERKYIMPYRKKFEN